MASRVPSLPEVLRDFVATQRRGMFGGWLPGRIETFDSSKNRASVQILLMEPGETEAGERTVKPMPIINDVPVQTLGDGYGVRIELALKRGDYVTVMFASRSVDGWLQQGGMVDPRDDRDHDLNDAICIPGLFDFAHVKKPTAKIAFTASTVEVGGSDTLALLTELQTVKTALGVLLAGLTIYVPLIKPIADPTNAATPAMLTALGTATTDNGTFAIGTQVLKGG